MPDTPSKILPFPPARRATIGVLEAARRKPMIHGLLEVDVSRARRRLREIEAATGERLSFTGFVVYGCARAVDADKGMHAYRDWRNRLVLFDDVDVSTTVERRVEGKREVVPTIIRAANRKSVREIHHDIRRAQMEPVREARVFRAMRRYLALPAYFGRLLFRILDRAPQQMKKHAGTVLVTSVGMFGRGAGWGIPVASHTLNVTVGGIVSKPCVIDGRLEEREHLCLTVSFDHVIVDGAPAARFVQRFRELLESAAGLEEHSR